jgi:hypothetical protein
VLARFSSFWRKRASNTVHHGISTLPRPTENRRMARKPGEKIRKKRQKPFNEKLYSTVHKCNVKNECSKA